MVSWNEKSDSDAYFFIPSTIWLFSGRADIAQEAHKQGRRGTWVSPNTYFDTRERILLFADLPINQWEISNEDAEAIVAKANLGIPEKVRAALARELKEFLDLYNLSSFFYFDDLFRLQAEEVIKKYKREHTPDSPAPKADPQVIEIIKRLQAEGHPIRLKATTYKREYRLLPEEIAKVEEEITTEHAIPLYRPKEQGDLLTEVAIAHGMTVEHMHEGESPRIEAAWEDYSRRRDAEVVEVIPTVDPEEVEDHWTGKFLRYNLPSYKGLPLKEEPQKVRLHTIRLEDIILPEEPEEPEPEEEPIAEIKTEDGVFSLDKNGDVVFTNSEGEEFVYSVSKGEIARALLQNPAERFQLSYGKLLPGDPDSWLFLREELEQILSQLHGVNLEEGQVVQIKDIPTLHGRKGELSVPVSGEVIKLSEDTVFVLGGFPVRVFFTHYVMGKSTTSTYQLSSDGELAAIL